MHLGHGEKAAKRRRACIHEFEVTKKALSHEIDVDVELYMDGMDSEESKGYLVMPFYDGQDLYDFIGDEQYFEKVSMETMLDIFYQILLRLSSLHYQKEMVHGGLPCVPILNFLKNSKFENCKCTDLKPENVMILENNASKELTVELIDYGVATSIERVSGDGHQYLHSKGCFGTKGVFSRFLVFVCLVFAATPTTTTRTTSTQGT